MQDIEGSIRRIAKFIGIELDPELLGVAKEQCSLSFMRSHADKYSEHMLKLNRNEACGIPRTAGINNGNQVMSCVFVLAETSVRSPQKLFNFIIRVNMYRIKVSQTHII